MSTKNKYAECRRFGVEVEDARKDLLIRVRETDLQGALCRDHQKCVVAKAVMRQIKPHWVDVGTKVVLIGVSEKKAYRYILNDLARKQVRWFDEHNGAFAPANVALYKPSPADQLGRYKGIPARPNRKLQIQRRRTRRKPTR